MRLTLLLMVLCSPAFAAGGSVEGTLTVKRDGKPAFVKNSLIFIRGYDTPPPPEPAKLAQTGRAFDKVVMPVVVKTKVTFANEEPENIYHAVFTPDKKRWFKSDKYRPQDTPYTTKPLSYEGPMTVFCDIHKEMISTVYVVPNDRFTVLSTAEGDSAVFKIDGIRPGKWTIVAWHRSAEKEVELPIEIVDGKTTKVNLIIDGASKIEQDLIEHQRREKGPGYKQKPDGGWMGEAIGQDEKWK